MTIESRLRELAERATPGSRQVDIEHGIVHFGPTDEDGERCAYEVWSDNGHDALLIASLDPSTVKKLCDVVEAAREATRYACAHPTAGPSWEMTLRVDALNAALSRLDEGEKP